MVYLACRVRKVNRDFQVLQDQRECRVNQERLVSLDQEVLMDWME
jgi:hypothetical protein